MIVNRQSAYSRYILQASLLFARKDWAPALLTNIRLLWKGLPGAKTYPIKNIRQLPL